MVRSLLPKFSSKSERRLLALCKNNPNGDPDIKQWNKNAVHYLLKKLKKNIDIIDELERAITQENPDTKCVLIPKNLDSRLLISHRRGLPQVVYCRLWRWPDLQSHHQIRAICHSETTIDYPGTVERPIKPSQTVCVNPLHYERKKSIPIEPVLVPRCAPKIPPDLSTSFEDSEPSMGTRAVPSSRMDNYPHHNHDHNHNYHQQEQQQLSPLTALPPTSQHIQDPQAGIFWSPMAINNSAQHQPHYHSTPDEIGIITNEQAGPGLIAPPDVRPQFLHQQYTINNHQQPYPGSSSQHMPHQQQTYPRHYSGQQLPQYQQFQQEQYSHPQYQVQPGGLHQTTSNQTEIAHPFQFKQNRFAPLARAMHECAPVNSNYNTNTYSSQPYTYPQSQYHQPHYSQPQAGTSAQHLDYIQDQTQLAQQMQYPMQPLPVYPTVHRTNNQLHYIQQEQMQLDHQDEIPMTMDPQTSAHYDPVVTNISGPSIEGAPTEIDLKAVPFVEGSTWCSITYHEYDRRVGEKYQPRGLTVSVDGHAHSTCSERFCIGSLSNNDRSDLTEWSRRRIGKGVKLTYVDGEVYVESLCETDVFVSSHSIVFEEGKAKPLERVLRLSDGSTVKVFSNHHFSEILANAVTEGFEAVYKLTNYCTLRVSFVKGWGRDYKRRSLLQIPCWVEVQLIGPLLWIDKVLRQMNPPTGCGSTS